MPLSSCFSRFGRFCLWRYANSTKLVTYNIVNPKTPNLCSWASTTDTRLRQTYSTPAVPRYASSYNRPSPGTLKWRRPKGMAVDPHKNHAQAPRNRVVRFLRPPGEVSDLKRLKRERLSPPTALAQWLDAETDQEKERYWYRSINHLSPSSLPNILLERLHRSRFPGVGYIVTLSRLCPDVGTGPSRNRSFIRQRSYRRPSKKKHDFGRC